MWGVASTAVFNSNFESIPTAVDGLTVSNNGSVSTASAGTNSYGFTNVASFNGSNSLSVNLGAIPQITTIDIIFKTTGSTDNKYMFAISNTGLVRRGGSSLAWYNNDADQVLSTTPDDRKWHHLRVTPKSLYFDGVETKTTSTTPNIYVSSNGYMALGAYRNDSGTIQYNGEIDIGLVKVHRGVDLGAPTSYPITTNGSLSSSVTTPDDGVIFAAENSAATTFNPFNTDINTVRGQESGYATLNPLDMRPSTVLSNGNLTVTGAGAAWYLARSTQFITTGKYYWEYKWYGGAVTESSGYQMGLKTPTSTLTAAAEQTGSFAFQYTSIYQTAGSNNTVVVSPGSITANDCVMFAYDADAGLMWFGVNGKWNDGANPALGTNSDWTSLPTTGLAPFAGVYNTTIKIDANFGQKPFKYAPPDGFQPINAANNRPVKVISRPDQYVGVTTFSIPDDGSGGSVTLNNDFDMVWTKNRTNNSTNHVLQDSVRGYGDNKNLHPNLNVQQTSTNNITAVNGRTLTIGSNNNYYDNNVAWSWKAGGSKNTFNVDDVGYASFAASGITAGTVTPTGISAGTKQGFSIIKYDGAGTSTSDTPSTIPHGLLQAPSFFIVKAISGDNAADDWFCYHQSLGASKRIRLNQSSGADTQSNLWGNGTSPTSSVISINKGWYSANYTGHTHILYAWHDVPGLQKFGEYSGNQSADGPFIELGFRPAMVWVKGIGSGSTSWRIFDKERNPTNTTTTLYLRSNSSNGDLDDTRPIDIVSNGFKIRVAGGGDINLSSGAYDYIYCAWADVPAIDLYGGGANAR